MRKGFVVILFAAFGLAVGQADAQDLPIEFEGRLGVAVPVGDWASDGDESLDPGLSFGASIGYRVIPMVTAYIGYTQNNYGADGDLSVSTGGFDVGARINLAAPMSPWLRVGLVFHEMSMSAQGFSFTSDNELGFEVGGGIAFPVADMISITPGIRYTTFTPSFDGQSFDDSADTLVIDLGVRVSL